MIIINLKIALDIEKGEIQVNHTPAIDTELYHYLYYITKDNRIRLYLWFLFITI